MAVDCYSALIVDDEPVLRQATARALARCGFRCDLAADGRQALEMLSGQRYQVVVTDLRMPEMNGHRLAVELLKKPDRPVVIVITGVTEQKLERDLRARGVDEILLKPVDYSFVASRAKALVESRATAIPFQNKGNSLPGPSSDGLGSSSAHVEPSPLISPTVAAADAKEPSSQTIADPISSRIARVLTTLPSPPDAFDALKEGTKAVITSHELVSAIEEDPRLIRETLRLVNAIAHMALQRIERLEQESLAMSAKRKFPWMLPAFVFAFGLAAGYALATWAG